MDEFVQAFQDHFEYVFLEAVADDKVPDEHLKTFLTLFSFADDYVALLTRCNDHAQSTDHFAFFRPGGPLSSLTHRILSLMRVIPSNRTLSVHGNSKFLLPFLLIELPFPLGRFFLLFL